MIAQLLKEKGMTQVEFAVKLGIQRTALTRLEVGKMNTTILNFKMIASFLDVTVKDLINF